MPAILQTPPAPPRTSRLMPASPNAPQVTCTNGLRQCPPSLDVPACFGLSRAARRRAEGSRREIPGRRLTRDSPFRCRVVATWPQETDDGSAAEPRQTPSSTPASEHTYREVGHYSSVGDLRDRVCAPHKSRAGHRQRPVHRDRRPLADHARAVLGHADGCAAVGRPEQTPNKHGRPTVRMVASAPRASLQEEPSQGLLHLAIRLLGVLHFGA